MSVSGSAAIQMFFQQEKMHEDLMSCITITFYFIMRRVYRVVYPLSQWGSTVMTGTYGMMGLL